MSDPEDIIGPELKAWIGRSIGRIPIPEPISGSEVRRYMRATGDNNPLWFDDDFARAAGYRGRVVPPMVVHEVFRRVGGEGGEWADPWISLPLPEGYTDARNAGSESEWLRPVYLNEPLGVECQITGIKARQGKSGAVTIFAEREERLVNGEGETVFRRLQTMAHLKPQPAAAKGAA
ncbi:MaoC family dehydratase [Brevundimonas guildfordensis]|uniref:MaoC family dehydratase N-terminal domain-containing protein n=1 Tax=Brevundimonas guildfordensis TaxID=2762241 RepID=A0ABR8QWQ1_9CAUL|nr:MaoC family dehydratase [Brevundimonas guildfordensis]MBD7939962.1 MaoC family dehydratase N-terminal domain-containing protein [Brevundimonas guildfordensis]